MPGFHALASAANDPTPPADATAPATDRPTTPTPQVST